MLEEPPTDITLLESTKSLATDAAVDAVSKRLAEKKAIWVGTRVVKSPIRKCLHQPFSQRAQLRQACKQCVQYTPWLCVACHVYLSIMCGMLLLQVDDDASDYDEDECQPTGRLKAYAGNTEALHEEQVMHRLHSTESSFLGPCRPCWIIRHQQHQHSTDT